MFRWQKPHNNLDVDVRFLLANERTLLAWIRTGLTLVAGGVTVAFVAVDSHLGTIAGLGAIALGGILSVIGYIRYQVTDTAIRNGKLPASGIGGLLTVVGAVIFAIILVIIKEFVPGS